jgi:hypothetical protein
MSRTKRVGARAACAVAAALAGALFAAPASAAPVTFNVNLTGAKETNGAGVFNLGDPNGSAVGSITLDAGSGGNTATASWNFTLSNLATPPVTDFHIHTGSATQAGSVLIPFGVNVAGGDTLTQDSFIGSRTGLNSTNMGLVLANPAGFYLNLHNGEFTPGAVRDQVPEPASLGALALAGMLLGRRRRR